MKAKTKNSLSLFALTWPIFIEILLHMLMGNADTLMLSQYSDDSVAAVGVANQIISIVIVMFGFVATGSSIVIAQLLGAEEELQARQVVVTSLSVNLLFGAVLSLVMLFFSESLLSVMNLPDQLMIYAVPYLQLVGGFSFVQALLMTIGASIRCYGFTKDAMYVTIGINILNVLGNYLFIFGPFGFPVLGVTGVAISTSVSRTIGVIIIAFLLLKRIDGQLPIDLFFRPVKKHIKSILKIGIPSAGEHLSYNTSQMAIMYFITMLGTEAITTKVYTQNIMMFIFLFSVSLGQGTQILIGHLVGAREVSKAYKACLRSLRYAMIISFMMAGVVSIFSVQLLGIFTDNPEILSLGSSLLLLTLILEPGRSFNLVVISSLRAAGDVRFPVYIGILSMWGISVPLSYILGIPFGYGLIGVWVAFCVDEWLRGLLMLWRWRSRVWERMIFVENRAG
ncbi:MATE family efflux transporter [Alkalihalobacillus sp. AL-G]|uniref:MATE family efflux transporter n=1 Tax=Alkalihalobacillus sp. AL-G TaxID=2926399 RepID=UPI00272BFBCB|nr:MATE family efflux transporter [Alkalihalobacillus sp. AL-G]WLD94858.1 MATE family efflux transporter [Alkalihalobacillus sp. AL-G]